MIMEAQVPEMPTKRDPKLTVLSMMGMCLVAVQQAEHRLAAAVESVFDDPRLRLMEQTEVERKKTLGELLKRLRQTVKIKPFVRDRLYHFLEMRNTFIHNISEVPGWDL